MQHSSFRILLMGVSGVGKSTVGRALASHFGLTFIEADDYHPLANKEKMAAGQALEDEDRWPWLEELAGVCAAHEDHGFVLACSALKKSYREVLASKMRYVMDIFLLHGDTDLISERMQLRSHFMPASLLQSQFDTLEISPDLVQISIEQENHEILENIQNHLALFHIAVIGLGVMGKSLARNFASRGMRVLAFNLPLPGEEQVTENFIAEFGTDSFQAAASLPDLVNRLAKPKKILLMVKAGEPVDQLIEQLQSLLECGDVVIDAGNSYFHDSIRRVKSLHAQGIDFVGMGVSGGESGALLGPSMMPAGADRARHILLPLLVKAAAQADQRPCVTWIGSDGAGHFVKMVHNGIEYTEMQIIAEVYHIAKNQIDDQASGLSGLFESWNQGLGASYLMEITADILQKMEEGEMLVEKILDQAGSKGTGLWTVKEALDLGVASPCISAALQERMISQDKSLRTKISKVREPLRQKFEIEMESLRSLLLFARMVALAEGFYLMHRAAVKYGWQLKFSEIAQIWRGGCIIRSELLLEIRDAFATESVPEHLFASSSFAVLLSAHYQKGLKAYKQICEQDISIPGISAAMQYYRSMGTDYLPTNLIQAQRDYFGAHTYQRLDGGEQYFHTKWQDE